MVGGAPANFTTALLRGVGFFRVGPAEVGGAATTRRWTYTNPYGARAILTGGSCQQTSATTTALTEKEEPKISDEAGGRLAPGGRHGGVGSFSVSIFYVFPMY